jgi:hypothetical protein
MTEPRLNCRTIGCTNTIQPAAAMRNDGYCGPCFSRIAHDHQAKYIQENRRTVDPYTGITDPVEVIRISHVQRPHDPLIQYLPCPCPVADIYANLTPPQIQTVIDMAIDAYKANDKGRARKLALELAGFTDASLDRLLHVWLDHDDFWYSLTFRSAGPDITRRVLDYLNGQPRNPNHALLAAAWIDSPPVLQTLAELDTSMAPWREKLFVTPSEYARDAGWEIVQGSRRSLTLPQCWAVTYIKKDSRRQPSPHVALCQEAKGTCPWCNRPLHDLIYLDHQSQAHAQLGLDNAPLRVTTCLTCTFFTTVYAELDSKGHPVLSTPTTPNDFVEPWDQTKEENPWTDCLKPILSPRPPMCAAHEFLPTTFTQIGGHPTWIQDSAYPTCPQCRKTMVFIAQLDRTDIDIEGIYYAFLCATCRVTATNYQQT